MNFLYGLSIGCAATTLFFVGLAKIKFAIRARGDALTRLNKAAEDNGEEL